MKKEPENLTPDQLAACKLIRDLEMDSKLGVDHSAAYNEVRPSSIQVVIKMFRLPKDALDSALAAGRQAAQHARLN